MTQPKKGQGAQLNPNNRFAAHRYDDESEYLDLVEEEAARAEYIDVFPKSIVSKNESPDVPSPYSINPYQGCEHGCAYCYARNSHEYWGYSMGLDFERKILVKKNAPELLRQHFGKKSWKPMPIMLSGNTDCYQPIERKLGITRKLLQVFLEVRNPVGIITKNALITRDIDVLQELAKLKLVNVALSINTLREDERQKLEPRTSSIQNKFKAMEALSKAGIPTQIMVGPVIPGLNSDEIPALLKRAAEAGASDAGYILVRLNGQLGVLFANWLEHHFPDRKEKVLNLIKQAHGGSVNNNKFKRRMKGEGSYATQISELFKKMRKQYFGEIQKTEYDLSLFRRPENGQMLLF